MTTTTLTTYRLPMQRGVALYHDAMGFPNEIGNACDLPLDRIDLRIALIREEGIEELSEAIAAHNVAEVIDALIDVIYVALGTLVEMGVEADCEMLRLIEKNNHGTSSLMTLAGRYLAANDERVRSLESALRAQNTSVAVYTLQVIVAKALQVLVNAGLDPQLFFDEIQRANMSKLGPNGERYVSRGWELDGAPLNKGLKGPNYVAPNIAAVYELHYGSNR